MTNKKKAYFRNLLTKRRDELLIGDNGAVNDMTYLNEKLPDPSDRATAESERNFTLKIKERELKLIDKISDALERIENGTYGICEACEEEISESRLKARPVTTLCIECKRAQEIEERNRGL